MYDICELNKIKLLVVLMVVSFTYGHGGASVAAGHSYSWIIIDWTGSI